MRITRGTRLHARSRKGERGGVLLLALMAVFAVSVLGASFLQLSSGVTKRQLLAVDNKRAFYLAEAGLSEAYVALLVGRTGQVGSQAKPAAFGEGVLWVDATTLDGDRIQLDSTGVVGVGRAVLSMVVQREDIEIAALGVFAVQDLELQKGSLVDGYDSSLGPYADQVASGDTLLAGRLATNGFLTITGSSSSPTWLHGDAVYGALKSIFTSSSGVTIKGATEAASAAIALPPVDSPEIELSPAVKHTSGVPLVVPGGSVGYEKLEIGKDASVVVLGPATLLLEELTLRNGATLQFDETDGPVAIHVTRELRFEADASLEGLGPDGPPASLYLGKADGGSIPIRVGDDALLHAFVYAPSSRVELGQRVEVFGALVADELDLDDGARLHFDRALGTEVGEGLPRLVSWRILEIAESSSAGLASLPPHLDRSTLLSPAQSQPDTWLDIGYKAVSGNKTTRWEGWFSEFDWSIVEELKKYSTFDEPGGQPLVGRYEMGRSAGGSSSGPGSGSSLSSGQRVGDMLFGSSDGDGDD